MKKLFKSLQLVLRIKELFEVEDDVLIELFDRLQALDKRVEKLEVEINRKKLGGRNVRV